VNIYIGDQMVCQTGQAHPFDEKQAHEHLSQVGCAVRIQLGRGRRGTRFHTTDLTAEYVRINADYST
jgi:glutamate N-acetyltransferase / amino-acid N-acetyltransferase